MSRQPDIESVASDPLINSDFAVFSSPTETTLVSTPTSETAAPMPTESDPLLRSARPRKPFHRARPLWLVPFAIVAALVVSIRLACARLHPHPFNHTLSPETFTLSAYSDPHLPPVYLTFEDNDEEEDPRRLPSNQCMSDSAVQAGAARLQTIMTTTMGLLSALTTGWWGHFGERHGRTKVMAIATLGLVLTDLMFILVSTPHSPFASHGHKLLILAPIIEGMLGGWSTLQSSTSAYISDCTSSGSRASVFSRFSGVFFFGFSMGPAIGGWIIRNRIGIPEGAPKSVAPVFYLASCCSLLNLLLVLFVFPESLSKEKQEMAEREYRVEHSSKGKGRDPRPVPVVQSDGQASTAPVELEDYKRPGVIRAFLSPLGLFLPVTITDASGTKTITDYSLTALAIGLFCTVLSTGIYQLKYLYADHAYGWGAEQLSYYVSFMGGSRAVFLLLVLPLFISTFKPKPKSSTKKNVTGAKPKPTKAHLAREISFDLFVARSSVVIDIFSNVLITLTPAPTYKVHSIAAAPTPTSTHSEALFVMASGLACIGSAVMPAIQSLALCILHARTLIAGGEVPEGKGGDGVGKLFGAFAVIQATGQMILGPMMFGLIYSGTVATFPKTIFVVAAGILSFALVCMMLVRNPVDSFKGKGLGKKKVHREDEVERGRSRTSKDLFGASTSGSQQQ
ncbi:MFS general substrate transporter [Hymenopellis radicata]|nr:MFS general substrate transporter [Hymenopellis radicata]